MTKRAGSEASLTPPPAVISPSAKRRKPSAKTVADSVLSDEFQQVTLQPWVDAYRIKGLGYGGDVYYQPDVRIIDCELPSGIEADDSSSCRSILRRDGIMRYHS